MPSSNSSSSGQERQGSVLTCEELKRYKLIRDADERSYQLASYDLRLGSCHYVFNHPTEPDASQTGRESNWQLIHIGSDEELSRLNEKTVNGQKYEAPKTLRHTLTIPPYGSAIIELKEKVDTFTAAVVDHKLIVGRFDLKLSQVYQALISQQATQVEPLYLGKLYCFIHNLSGNSILMREGEKIATIEFSYAGEQLSEDERASLILEYQKTVEKYSKSSCAAEGNRGIGEVRWFYEQDRLPSDCGLNGLYSDVEKEVNETSKHFKQTFEDFIEKDETLKRIADRVQSRIHEQQRNLEILVTVVMGAVSLGVGSLLWMFYQELVKVNAKQEFINIYLSGKDDALEIGMVQNTPERLPWLFPYIVFIVIVVFAACAIYFYAEHKGKEIDRENQRIIRRELSAWKEQLFTEIDDLHSLKRKCKPLETKQDDLEGCFYKMCDKFSEETSKASDLLVKCEELEKRLSELEAGCGHLLPETSQAADSESQTLGAGNGNI